VAVKSNGKKGRNSKTAEKREKIRKPGKAPGIKKTFQGGGADLAKKEWRNKKNHQVKN